MISTLALLAALAAPPTATPPPAPVVPAPAAAPAADPVKDPEWLAIPGQSLMANCTTGYLTDPTFTGEQIVMGCVVQPDGSLDQCRVRETKRAQAAHVDDVAVCASGGFRIGPKDKQGKPTVGRPILIPMAIVTAATPAPGPAPAASTPPAGQP